VEYYRTEQGRGKKSMQNGKRQQRRATGNGGKDVVAEQEQAEGDNAQMVEHVRMVTSLLEGRKVSRQEVLKMLARAKEKRQHSIGGDENTEYRARDQNKDSS